MDFNIPPINPSGVNPINPSSDPSMVLIPLWKERFTMRWKNIMRITSCHQRRPKADLTKLIEAAKRLQKLVMCNFSSIQMIAITLFILALYKVGDGTDGAGEFPRPDGSLRSDDEET